MFVIISQIRNLTVKVMLSLSTLYQMDLIAQFVDYFVLIESL